MNTETRAAGIGLAFPDILLPAEGVDISRWAVIACDQFTSEPGYWREVERHVGDAASTLHLIIPEADLESINLAERAAQISSTMEQYLGDGTLRSVERSMVLVRRSLGDGTERHGIVAAVDLEEYDFSPESTSLIRASEETIPARLPARMDIRRDAALESPHVLVLYDDPESRVLSAVRDAGGMDEQLYTAELMQGGGHVAGFRLAADSEAGSAAIDALAGLPTREQYGFRFATGDGNHSLAAAKALWEEARAAGAADNDPRRWCLVELVNVHDPGMPFHPIHRLVDGSEHELLDELLRHSDARFHGFPLDRIAGHIAYEGLSRREIAFVGPKQAGVLTLPEGGALPVAVADEVIARVETASIDYVHGFEEVVTLSEGRDAVAVVLPEIDRSGLFAGIHHGGALPRKAFSLGEARDKRYYLECRALRRPD